MTLKNTLKNDAQEQRIVGSLCHITSGEHLLKTLESLGRHEILEVSKEKTSRASAVTLIRTGQNLSR